MTSRKPSQQDAEKGRDIARLRGDRDLSQAALGQMIGKSGSQISKYELGKNRMSATVFDQLMAVLDPKPWRRVSPKGRTFTSCQRDAARTSGNS